MSVAADSNVKPGSRLQFLGVLATVTGITLLLVYQKLVVPLLSAGLQDAAIEGQGTRARLLLFLGADANDADTGFERDPPLILAAAENRSRIVELLLRKGANVNVRGEDGETALISAARIGSTKIVQDLLRYGADPNIRAGSSLTTAALEAADLEAPEILQQLINARADLTMKNEDGDTALHRVARSARNRSAAVIISAVPQLVSVRNNLGHQALCAGIEAADLPIVAMLLNAGAPVTEHEISEAVSRLARPFASSEPTNLADRERILSLLQEHRKPGER